MLWRTVDGHSPLGDITNTYDSRKQFNHLWSNILDNKYMLCHQQFWFSITDIRVGISTYPILRDGIKCAVLARAEKIKGAKGYKSALKYVYEYVKCHENHQEFETEETFYENLDYIRFRMESIVTFLIKII